MQRISLSLASMLVFFIVFSAGSAQVLAVNQETPSETKVCGPVTTDTTWTTDGSPYVIECFDVTVEQGVTLTIDPGVTVRGKAHNIGLTVKGHLHAAGTADLPILFTSLQNTGANQWLGIKVDGGTAFLRHATVRFGNDNLYVRNTFSGEVRIEESRIEAANRYGVDSAGSRIVISNTAFININAQTWSRPLRVDAGDVGNLTGNHFEGNTQNQIQVRGSALTANATWQPQSGLQAYEVEGRVDVNAGVTLAIAPGVTVMGGGSGSFWVKGTLEAVGTAGAPILFTSAQNTGPHQWNGLNFDGGEGILRYVTVRYASNNIYAINGSRLEVRDSVITRGGSDGLLLRNSGSATIACSDITDNKFAGVRLDGSFNAVIVGSALTGNGNHGVQSGTQNVVDARYNWWGDSSGPGGEGPGTGNAISKNVQYEPWLQDKRCVNLHEGYWDFGSVRIWADAFGGEGSSVEAMGNVRLGVATTATPYIAVEGSASFPLSPSADSKITISGATSLTAENLPLGADVFTVDQACLMTGAFVSTLLIKGSSHLPIQVSQLNARLCAKDKEMPGLYGQGVIPIGFLPNNAGKQVTLNFRFVEEEGAFHWRGDATADVTLKLAGGTYSAKFKLDDAGLVASSVKLNLPKIGDAGLNVEIKDLRIGLDGKVGGSVSEFSVDLVGFALEVKKPGFDGNRIQAVSVKVKAKPELSGLKELRVAGSLTGLTIDENGLRIEGGGFDLAFKVDDIGIAGKANFAPDPTLTGTYLIKIDAEVKLPDFGMEAGVTLALLSDRAQVRRVFVAIQARPPNAPTVLIEPNSQLYLYRVEGEITLTEARQAIEVAVKGKSLVEFDKKPLLEATAGLVGEWRPKNYLRLHGTVSVLKYPIGKASLLFTPTSVWLEGSLGIREEKVVLAVLLKGALGLDATCEFTAVLQVEGETTVKAHAAMWGLPPWDVTAKLGGTVGKHRYQSKNQWGLRAYGEFPLIGQGWVWVGFTPGSTAEVGTGDGRNIYRPIWPAEAGIAAAMDVNPQMFAPGISLTVASDSLLYVQQEPATGEFTIGVVTEFLLVEYLPEGAGMDAPALQLIVPDGTSLTPSVIDTSSEHNTRYYKVTDPQQGRWQVTAAPGAYVSVLGTNPKPVVRSATIVSRSGGYAIDYEITDHEPLDDALVWVEVIAPPEGDNSGQQVIIDPTSGGDGPRCPVPGVSAASHVTRDGGLRAAGNVQWTPVRLASGDYQVRLVVSNGVHTIVHDIDTINWQDSTPPAPPANLQATTTAEGALHLRWEPGDADTSGYRVQIGDGSVLEQRSRHLNEFWTTGFNPGEGVEVRVASVDPSGNASPFVSAFATWPAVGIAVQEWIPRAEDHRVSPGQSQVVVRFREEAKIHTFTVTGLGGPLTGTWEPIVLFPNTDAPVSVGGWWQPSSGGMQDAGRYTAAVTGVDEGGGAFNVTWSWTVLEPVEISSELYVPSLVR